MSDMLWIPVPGGTLNGASSGVMLRVVIVPRLQGTTLQGEGLEHWPPPSLVTGTLTVEFAERAGGPMTTVLVTPPHVRFEAGAWERLFSSDTVVEKPRSGIDAVPRVTVDATAQKADAVHATFAAAATARVVSDHADRPEMDAAIRTELKSRWSTVTAPTTPAPSLPQGSAEPPGFHRVLSMLREHPAVLAALGLIVELKLPNPPPFATGVVRVGWRAAPAALPAIVSPWTKYERPFLPASTPNISAGMVALTDDRPGQPIGNRRWEVVSVDVDDAARRLRETANALRETLAQPPVAGDAGRATTQSRVTLPALRSAGLLLLRRGRQEDFDARRATAATDPQRRLHDDGLTAEDLLLGYRIDVMPSGEDWLSLHERDAEYRLGTGSEPVKIGGGFVREEGHVKAYAAVNDGSGTLRADEVVARWSGWSLAVRRPAIGASPDRGRAAPAGPADARFQWTYKVPGKSLPRLRFGQRYALRARVADIAGGGIAPKDHAANRCFIDDITYRRYEPMASPAVTLPPGHDFAKMGPGEAMAQLVLRSDAGLGAAEFAAQNPRYALNARRDLLVPRTSLTLSEQHGATDGVAFEQIRKWISDAMAGSSGAVTPDDVLLPDFAVGGVCAFVRPGAGSELTGRFERSWAETWPQLIAKQIELREAPAGTPASIEWVHNPADESGRIGDRLVVQLGKGGEVTLEISAVPKRGRLEEFAIEVDTLPDVSRNSANQGRHPLVTPAHVVTLTHAVRRPLGVPAGKLACRRDPGQTFARLEPDPPQLGIDTQSTAQLELVGTWTERDDDASRQIKDAPVQTVIVHRGDAILNGEAGLRHEFGDTRHRSIRYGLKAVSRFRQFFDTKESDDAFVARTDLPQLVNILSAARPPAPIVLSVRPAFVWQETREAGPVTTLVRRRSGGLLRVELDRPWFQTGDGEQLGVITGFTDSPPAEMWPFLTQLARDPIWGTTTPKRWPGAAAFSARAGEPASVVLPEIGAGVRVVPHEVWFHPSAPPTGATADTKAPTGCWYADISLAGATGDAYCPFVQLAVARYQRNSLTNLELSRVVQTEMVQLLPDRSLTMKRSGDNLSITLDGVGPASPRRNRVDVILERLAGPPGHPADTFGLAALESTANFVPAWVPVPNQTHSSTLGAGEIALQVPRGLGPLRIRVREIELIGVGSTTPGPLTGTHGELLERSVYSDVVSLD
jgi:hypothetical protein